MRLNNSPASYAAKTHGGAPAVPHLTPLQQLRRAVMACLLWEDGFYEDGVTVADRIEHCVYQVSQEKAAAVAIEARNVHHLRHVPLLIAAAMAKRGSGAGHALSTRCVADTLYEVIQRPDELSEFLSIYWRDGKTPISKQVKKGLAKAFTKFSQYQLAKYNSDRTIKLRDVLFMVHAKPIDDAQAAVWKLLVDKQLPPPDTWEVQLSGGADKKATFERLITEGNLGYLALLRNLRNMAQAGCDMDLVRDAILARKGASKVLPFRYVAAARACPQLEPAIDAALSEAIADLPVLPGKTVVLVDVSGSMAAPLSGKSDMTRMDAACALASIINGDVRMFSFSNRLVEVPPRRGMAGVDALRNSQPHGGTALAGAMAALHTKMGDGGKGVRYDRLIVITDEQVTDGAVPDPTCELAYMINVASNKNGVGYGRWSHIDGFSEGVLRWIAAAESDVSELI